MNITTYDLGDGSATAETVAGQTMTVFDGGTGPAGPGVATGGSTGQVLAKASTADFDTEWVDQTGGGGGGAVDSVNGHTGIVVLTASDVGADASGAAATALTTAEGYTDAHIAAEVTRANAAYDPADAAATALTTAEAYTDTAISGEVTRANAAYDALGAAAAAQAAAIAASQPLDSDLTAIAALATTSFGRSLLTSADAAALRTAAALGTAATSAVGDFDAAGAAAAAQAASQPLDADLTSIAALSTTTFGRALLTQADAAALRTTAGLGTAATQASSAFDTAGAAAAAQAASQPLDSDLTAIAALTTTSYGRAFLALADAAAARTALGLGTLATQSGTFSGTSSGTNTGDQTLPTTLPPNGAAGGDLTGTYPNPTLGAVATAGTTGDASHSLTVTIDAKGRTTAVTANSIAIAASQVTSGVLAVARLATGTPDGTKFVRDDGTLAAPSGGGGSAIFGDGSDGTVTFDGSTTVVGATLSGSTYTLNRDVFYAAATLNGGILIKTNGFRLFVAGALTNNGTIHFNGNNASGSTAGANISTPSSFGYPAATPVQATAGGAGTTTTGGNGGNVATSFPFGGRGGAGGAGNPGAAGTAGTMGTLPTGANALPHSSVVVWGPTMPMAIQGLNILGGSGGGGGGGDSSFPGGGGGGGGAIAMVIAKTITGTGAIQARGGNGANAPTAGNTGGGGGGGGGVVIVVSRSVSGGAISGQTIDANGGTGGTKLGTGANGTAGSNGLTLLIPD